MPEQEIIVEVRLPADTRNICEALALVGFHIDGACKALDAGEVRGCRWEIRRPVMAPANVCRMCIAPVTWSPLCSACCGVVERVQAAIESLGGCPTREAIAERLQCVRGGLADSVLLRGALEELEARGAIFLMRGCRVRLALRSEATVVGPLLTEAFPLPERGGER